MSINSSISEQVEDLLRSRGVTQVELARVLYLSQPSVNARLHNRVPWTTGDLERLAAHFDVDVADLLMPRVAVS